MHHVSKSKLPCPLSNFNPGRMNAASVQQRYLVFCCKSRKVQLCLQGSAKALHHQCCCFLWPAVTLVILCSSCSDWAPRRGPTLRNVCRRFASLANKDSLSASSSLWFVGFTDFVAAHCYFFITVCESHLVGIRKWLCLFTYLGQKLMWYLHHPDLASGPWNSLWSLFGFISPQSKNVIIWPILYLDEMKLCPEMPIFLCWVQKVSTKQAPI